VSAAAQRALQCSACAQREVQQVQANGKARAQCAIEVQERSVRAAAQCRGVWCVVQAVVPRASKSRRQE